MAASFESSGRGGGYGKVVAGVELGEERRIPITPHATSHARQANADSAIHVTKLEAASSATGGRIVVARAKKGSRSVVGWEIRGEGGYGSVLNAGGARNP